jgi:hypothetical protein
VQITVDAPSFDTTFTASGSYSLSTIAELQNASYTITPFKNDDPLQGLSTFDLVLMSKHILGLDPFTEPWQLIAADLNCSGSITTFDIIEGRKLILGISSGFPGCGGATWRFVPDPDGAPANGACLHFRGVKLGDLTGPYFSPDTPVDDRDRTRLGIENQRIERGRTYRIHVRARPGCRLTGFQLALGLDPAVLNIHRIEAPVLHDFDERNYNLDLQRTDAYVPVSWSVAGRPVDIRSGDILLSLEVEALQSALLSDVLGLRQQLRAEAYAESGEVRELELEWRDQQTLAPLALSLSPNPARDVVYAVFDAEKEGEVLLQLADARGNVVLEKTHVAATGANRVELRPIAPLSGLYFVKIDGRTGAKVAFDGKR